jgi:hypothetical protein
MYYLKDILGRFTNTEKLLKRVTEKGKKTEGYDFEKTHNGIKEAYLDFLVAINELKHIEVSAMDGQLSALAHMLPVIDQSFKAIKDEQSALAFLGMFEVMKDYKMFERYDEYDFPYDLKDDIMQHVMDTNILNSVAKAIKLHGGRHIRVLDTYCCYGDNIFNMKNSLVSNGFEPDAVELYAINKDKNFPWSARERVTRLILGGLKGCTISNEAFDIIVSAPPVTFERGGRAFIEKIERDYLYKIQSYLRPGGVMVFSIPYFRLFKEMATFISRNFKDITVLPDKGQSVTIIGTKLPRAGLVDSKSYVYLRNMSRVIGKLREDPPAAIAEVTLPYEIAGLKKFRGALLDEAELDAMYDISPCTSQFWKSQKVEKLSEHTKHPLLPFNVGQIGLVLTSGCLDGVIDEGDGNYHTVKGRVVKRVDTVNDVDASAGQIEVSETTTNRVEINMFLPDGTYKSLA